MLVYIHIGTEKTGTTSIQQFLGKNKSILTQHGVAPLGEFVVPDTFNNIALPLAAIEDAGNDILAYRQDEFNKELFFFGGKIAIKLGRTEQAEKYFREAIALDPGYTEAALTLNKLFFQQERYEDIIDLISQLDIVEDEEPQLLWDSALAYNKLEQYSYA